MLFRSLYTIGILLYTLAIRFAAAFNDKAAQWVEGRKNQTFPANNNAAYIWFHAASLGEFEQGRPLIEAIKKHWPEKKILLSFFSPSGYEIRKNYELASKVIYLPADTPSKARHLLDSFHIEMAFFIKYEFWFNYLNELRKRRIPTYFVSAKFRQNQMFFRWYGGWFSQQLKHVNHYFVQDENSAKLIETLGIKQYTVTGDTRFDRVYRLSRQAMPLPKIEAFARGRRLFVIGSSWPSDEKILIESLGLLPKTHAVVIAPHDISGKHLAEISQSLKSESIRYSDFNEQKDYNILIIDNIGLLSSIYRYADFAWIGGGFGHAIHNIQEAVAYGCPVMFGPNYHRFAEAVDLIKLGGAFEVNSTNKLNEMIRKFIHEPGFRMKASEVCRQYVGNQIGATDKIMAVVFG